MNSKNGKMPKIENNSTIKKGQKDRASEKTKNESGPRLWTEVARKMLDDGRARIQNE